MAAKGAAAGLGLKNSEGKPSNIGCELDRNHNVLCVHVTEYSHGIGFFSGIIFMLAIALTFPEKKLRRLPERRTFPLSTKWAASLLLIFGMSCTYIIANVVY